MPPNCRSGPTPRPRAIQASPGSGLWRSTGPTLLAFLLSAIGLWAQTETTDPSTARPFPASLTCYSTIFEPFVLDDDETVRGADVDLLREVGKRLGVTIDVELIPWLRLEEALRNQRSEVDCGFAFFRTEAREQYMEFTSVPLHVTDYVLFVRDSDAAAFEKSPLRPGMTLAVNRGFSIPPVIEEAASRGEIIVELVSEESQSLRMLSLERIDAVLTHRSVGRFVRDRLGLEGIVAIEPPLLSRPAFLVFSDASWRALALEVDRALVDIEADGTLGRIRSLYSLD